MAVKSVVNPVLIDGDRVDVAAIEWDWQANNAGVVDVSKAPNQMSKYSGYVITHVLISSGSPAPTSAYDVKILNDIDVDILFAAGDNITANKSIAVTSQAPPLYGTLRLQVTGNAVAWAMGRVVVMLRRVAANQLVTLPS